MENKTVILLGGGKSISEGIELGLWEKIKDFEIWSINFGFMTMPYLPQREVWTDISFFRNNISALQELHEKKVKLYCKWHHKYDNFPQINTVKCARSLPLSPDKMYIGEMGLSGFFALGLATREKYSFIFCLGYDFGSDTNKTHYYQDDIKVESTGLESPAM